MVATEAPVGQAVGMLRLVYGVTVSRAREILTWRAQETGTAVTEFAARLCAAVTDSGIAAPASARTRVDDLLLTAHERGGQG